MFLYSHFVNGNIFIVTRFYYYISIFLWLILLEKILLLSSTVWAISQLASLFILGQLSLPIASFCPVNKLTERVMTRQRAPSKMTVHATSFVSSPHVRSRTWRNWLFQCLIYCKVCCHSPSGRRAARTPLSPRFIFVSFVFYLFIVAEDKVTNCAVVLCQCFELRVPWHWRHRFEYITFSVIHLQCLCQDSSSSPKICLLGGCLLKLISRRFVSVRYRFEARVGSIWCVRCDCEWRADYSKLWTWLARSAIDALFSALPTCHNEQLGLLLNLFAFYHWDFFIWHFFVLLFNVIQ